MPPPLPTSDAERQKKIAKFIEENQSKMSAEELSKALLEFQKHYGCVHPHGTSLMFHSIHFISLDQAKISIMEECRDCGMVIKVHPAKIFIAQKE